MRTCRGCKSDVHDLEPMFDGSDDGIPEWVCFECVARYMDGKEAVTPRRAAELAVGEANAIEATINGSNRVRRRMQLRAKYLPEEQDLFDKHELKAA